ncbi:hypothetical protein NUH88_03605 [Nisaea acidiphila]|uniref:Folate/biopterin family MFS transporter n=1 Tax=Nisaea acidiphila TaxID=1862145 RepID=A0A9J7ATZ4_9PROT|nr:hypothetical protein [Nisaea acidiphila]UUX50791.1 hypothetical protein NUH88_03605 [Nisaea acidiphila]
MTITSRTGWLHETFAGLIEQMRWSYLPPLMVYLAYGISGLTSIVGTFFVKEYLDLSAAFLAGLGFWAGIPWALKMPVGHLVDIIWKWKGSLVYLGAALIAASLLIMYGLIAHTVAMTAIFPATVWFVISTLLAPMGFVLQDAVADAMTVEAVPALDEDGEPFAEDEIKAMHTTMQMLGRFALIGGIALVAVINITMFDGVELMSESEKAVIYADIHLIALAVPAISIAGVILGGGMLRRRAKELVAAGVDPHEVDAMLFRPDGEATPNWWIFGGSLAFGVFTVSIGLSGLAYSQEIVFAGSMAIVCFLISRLLPELAPAQRLALIGTSTIVFFFRAVPGPGPGATWFEIDMLGFDQQFISVLTLISAALALVGMVVLRPLMASRSIAYIVALLTVFAGVLSLPNIGLYYGLHEWTAPLTGGVVDARFIAILDTAIESPLAQVSMIPMLAWIARNAPSHLKATFFAVMASFVNLALSARAMGTKYVNEIFLVTREVKDRTTGEITVPADYSELGMLLIVVAALTVIVPLAAIFVIQSGRFRTRD